MRQTGAVFFASLLILSWRAATPGMATAYVDPVAHIQAQDEAVYASSSFQMVRHGDWLTPRFLGRYALYKPPLLYWLSAINAEIVGTNAWAVRIPSIFAGAATVALVFAWLRVTMPLASALAGALLLLSSHLFFVLSRTGLMDALLIFEITLAMYAVARDARLDAPASRWIFGIATGAAIMTKAIAGLLPVVILVLAGVSFLRLAQVCAIAAGVALPWHLAQFYLHPRWFWAEYIIGEHLTWGLSAPEQSTVDSQIAYYGKRIFTLDPALIAAAIVAAFRTRSRLLIAWIGVVLLSVLAWTYRNTSYLAPIYPALAIYAALAIPKQKARLALAFAGAIFFVKILIPHQPFGIPFVAESTNPSHAQLDAYAALRRGNDLIVVEPDDQFYSADLDLPKVRYLWLSAAPKRTQAPLDFEYLGITMTASDFARLDHLRPILAQRLREWNLDSGDPIASVIFAQTEDEVRALIAANPQADFYVPDSIERRKFVLSREVVQRP